MQFPVRTSTISGLILIALASATYLACSGEDGLDGSEVAIDQREADKDECEYGGTVVVVGEDEHVICDGAPGEDGEDGEAGPDGESPAFIAETEEVEPGEDCQFGGQRVVTGVDEDGDGELSDDEVENEVFLCNETCPGGEELAIDYPEVPLAAYNGYEHRMPVDTTADDLAFAAYDAAHIGVGEDAPQFLAPPAMQTSYDADDQEMIFTITDGELSGASFVVMATDGCNTTFDVIDIQQIVDGEAQVYVAHLAPELDDYAEINVEAPWDEELVEGLEAFEVSGPHSFDWDTQQQFEVFDEDGELIDTTDDLTFDTPWATKTIYVYDEADEPVLGVTQPDTSPVAAENARMRAIHKTDGGIEVDFGTKSDGSSTIHYEELNFPNASDAINIDADPEAYMGFDTGSDGELDLTYMSTMAWLSEGSMVDLFAVADEGVFMALVIDYTSGQADLHDPEAFTVASMPDMSIPQEGGIAEDTVNVSDCGTVEDINMDFHAEHETGFYTTNFTVYLENAEGDEYPLWSRGDEVIPGDDVNFMGNFNETIPADSGIGAPETDVEEIDIFEGSDGDGEWTLRVLNDSCCTDGHLHHWALNLVCDD